MIQWFGKTNLNKEKTMDNLLFSITEVSVAITSTLLDALGIGYLILYNAVGVLSIIIQFLAYQMREKHAIVKLGIVNDVGWFSYFFLQGDLISGTANIIGIMSKILILLREKHPFARSIAWNFFFIGFAGVYSLLTFKVWSDIFPMLACMVIMLAFFMKKEKHLRFMALFAFCFFMSNSISKGYTVALIADITAFASIVIALIKYRRRERDKEVA